MRLLRGVGLGFTLGVLIVLGIGIAASFIIYGQVCGAPSSAASLLLCGGLVLGVHKGGGDFFFGLVLPVPWCHHVAKAPAATPFPHPAVFHTPCTLCSP